MARFASAKRLASWAGVCPGHHESAGHIKNIKAPTSSAPWTWRRSAR
ncbi:transposase [Streptomyces sp. NPDC004546]